MQKNGLIGIAGENVLVVGVLFLRKFAYVAKKLTAELPEKIILCFKMGVKGCPSHIRTPDNIGNCDLAEAFVGKQVYK